MGRLPSSIFPSEARVAHVAFTFQLAEIYVPFVPRPLAYPAGGLTPIPLRERRSSLMTPFSERPASLSFPTRGGHLGRLHSNLLDLDERLREAVAQAVDQAAAGVVGQVVLSLLGQADYGPALLRVAPHQPSRSRPLWQTLDD